MKKIEHNVATGEIFERDMTKDELALHKADQAQEAIKATDDQIKLAAKAALLERLGITADEAALLLS